MASLRRSRRDDVDVDSVFANLHRIADITTLPIRRIIDLRRSEDDDVVGDDGATAEASGASARR